MRQALAAFGVDLSKPERGSHWPASRDGVRYPIPLHNALKTEVSEIYIKGVCRAFHIDVAELRKLF